MDRQNNLTRGELKEELRKVNGQLDDHLSDTSSDFFIKSNLIRRKIALLTEIANVPKEEDDDGFVSLSDLKAKALENIVIHQRLIATLNKAAS